MISSSLIVDSMLSRIGAPRLSRAEAFSFLVRASPRSALTMEKLGVMREWEIKMTRNDWWALKPGS